MKQLIFVLFVIYNVFTFTLAHANPSIFYDTKGHAVELSHLKGKWVVVNYWAGWCSACLQEIPELNRFYQKIQNTNVVFYGVDYDELSLADLNASVESTGIQYPILTSDPGEAWGLESSDVIPTTYIINPEGRVVKVITGTNTERSLLEAIVGLQQAN
jgi:thiol-disulfide isomerase/thioredoxin